MLAPVIDIDRKRSPGRPPSPVSVALEHSMDITSLAMDNVEWDAQEPRFIGVAVSAFIEILNTCPDPTVQELCHRGIDALEEWGNGDLLENLRNPKMLWASREVNGWMDRVPRLFAAFNGLQAEGE